MIASRTTDKHRNHSMALVVNIFLGKPFGDNELGIFVFSLRTHAKCHKTITINISKRVLRNCS
jgi:hypothetical protein